MILLVVLYKVPNEELLEFLITLAYITIPLKKSVLISEELEKRNIKGILKFILIALILFGIIFIGFLGQVFLWNVVFRCLLKMDLMALGIKKAIGYLIIFLFWRIRY